MHVKQKHTAKKEILARIAHHLIINTSFLSDLGLYHGKMGIILFFVHYFRYTEKIVYDDFAGELMDEITEDIHTDFSVNFENGLSGIGWGTQYLIKNGYMEGEPDEILSDIDQKIMERDLGRISDTSICTGLKGISYYIERRIELSKSKSESFDKDFLNDYLYLKQKNDITIPDDAEILSEIYRKIPQGDNITQWQLGVESGCAGYGLKLILE